jgi:hypothetical protein
MTVDGIAYQTLDCVFHINDQMNVILDNCGPNCHYLAMPPQW